MTSIAVLSVSAQSDDFYLNGVRKPDVKTIDDCVIKRFSIWETAGLLGTNCDVGSGNSGGPLLTKSSSRTFELFGISVGSASTKGLATRRNAAVRRAFHENKWSSYAVPLIGQFPRGA